jgi:hypothetical protein
MVFGNVARHRVRYRRRGFVHYAVVQQTDDDQLSVVLKCFVNDLGAGRPYSTITRQSRPGLARRAYLSDNPSRTVSSRAGERDEWLGQ